MIKEEHFGAPPGRSELDRGLGQRFVHATGEAGPLAVVAIIGDTLGERSITAQRENGEGVHVSEASVQSVWHGEAWPEPKRERHSRFLLTRYPQEFADKHHQGYRFVVKANGMLPHTAFYTASELVKWASLYNLDLPCAADELETAELQWAEVRGQYERVHHANTLSFDLVDDALCINTRALDNGKVTAAKRIVDMDAGLVCLHVAGANCRDRQTFDKMVWPHPNDRLIIYVPGERSAQDEAHLVGGEIVGLHGHMTLAQIRERYPTAAVYYESEVATRIEDLCRTEPVEISAERFSDARDAMPPMGWVTRGASESFKFSELYSGDITSVFARMGERCFTFRDNSGMPHEQVLDKIRRSGLLEQPSPEFEEEAAEAPRMR